jgi:hypothetical protein
MKRSAICVSSGEITAKRSPSPSKARRSWSKAMSCAPSPGPIPSSNARTARAAAGMAPRMEAERSTRMSRSRGRVARVITSVPGARMAPQNAQGITGPSPGISLMAERSRMTPPQLPQRTALASPSPPTPSVWVRGTEGVSMSRKVPGRPSSRSKRSHGRTPTSPARQVSTKSLLGRASPASREAMGTPSSVCRRWILCEGERSPSTSPSPRTMSSTETSGARVRVARRGRPTEPWAGVSW